MSIKVLVIDDSALMRKLLVELINRSADVEAVGSAPDAITAREMIKTLNPDVLTLDVQMPKMDGIEFLERLMRLRPMPVVMVSAYTAAGSETALRALELGAFDFIGKPRAESAQSTEDYAQELLEKIRAAHGASLRRVVPPPRVAAPPLAPVMTTARTAGRPAAVGDRVVFVGASTGGTEAIKHFLAGLPENCPPVLVVQHMPETFTASFAKRLDSLCPPRVIEAQGGERIESGTVYIAPGHSHLQIRRSGNGYVTEILATPPVNRHRPSVDVLFDSAALLGRQALGVILTGMGKDGAQGLLRMRQAGARTFGQDEASCVVYGMPREAALVGAVEEVASLDEMARRVLASLGRSMA
ncbi:MAG: chemotaxis response regulator protein-glutamate methylesterase [Candidatus Accumulibacter sp.]|nr:chemotaxis response regulator protein-glutamate methylesterase [Accumulibacter sp.]